MKKHIKIVALCLSVLSFCAFFAGCSYIDELRADHAILSDDRQSIIYNNTLYKRLPDIAEEESFYWNSFVNNINVTAKDVPVLLSDAICHYANYEKERDIITVSFDDGLDSSDIFSAVAVTTIGFDARYCNAKDYDKYMEAINENQLDKIGFQYDVSSKEGTYTKIEVGGENLSKEVLGHIENNEKMTEETYNKVYKNGYIDYLPNSLLQCDAYGVNIYALAGEGYDLVRLDNGKVFLVNDMECTAVELSNTAVNEIKNEYFNNKHYYDENPTDGDAEIDHIIIYD